jgi:outer membrane protein assembly factor BamB
LIDLGVVPEEPVAIPPAPRRQFRVVLVVLAVAMLVLLGGAAPAPGVTPPVTVPAAIDGRVVVRENKLFVIDPGRPIGGPGKRQVVHAYALPDVSPLFDQAVTVTGEIIDVRAVTDDLLLVEERGYTDAARSIIAVRPGVAEPLWRHDGVLVGVAPGGPAVFGSDSYLGDDLETPVEWRGVDLATGATRWTVRKALDERAVTDSYRGDPRWLYVLGAGRLTAYDTRDGRPAAEVPQPGLRPDTAALWPLDGRLLVGGGTTGTTIFDTAGGLVPVAHADRNLDEYLTGYDCGELICAYATGGGLTGLDRRTLAKVWSVKDAAFSMWIDGYVFATDPTATEPRIRRSDPVTGRAAGQLDGWQLTISDGETFYVRRREDGRVWFGVFDPGRLRVRPLVVAEGVTDECLIEDDSLVCRKIDANVGVWSLR